MRKVKGSLATDSTTPGISLREVGVLAPGESLTPQLYGGVEQNPTVLRDEGMHLNDRQTGN